MDGNNTTGGNGLMGKMREGAVTQLGTQKDRATDGLGSVAQAIRHTTQQLRDEQHDTIARYVDGAANQVERFANHLRGKDVGELLRDAQQFAQRRPAVFIGSAFAIGLLGARFFKSSRDDQSSRGDQSAYATTPDSYHAGHVSRPLSSSPGFDRTERF